MSRERPTVRLALQRTLGARLAPLTLLVAVVTCFAAPTAFFVLGLDALEVRGDGTAREAASLLRRDVQERPVLWKYDAAKVVARVAAFELPGVDRVVVVDAGGAPLRGFADDGDALAELEALWRSADIEVGGEVAGTVWVAVSTRALARNTIALSIGFALIGVVLGGVLYWLPMWAVGRAEHELRVLVSQLETSQHALGQLNATLEQQVETRSAELRDALAQLGRKEQRIRDVSARAVRMQEAERRGIARELHDSAGQALTAVRIHLQLIADILAGRDGDDAKITSMARRTLGMVDGTVEEIRRAVNQLGPAVLDDVGLEAAVRRAAEDASETTSVEVRVEYAVDVELDASVETTAYRLVQESLTNVARHSQASTVIVSARVDADVLCIGVQDDGVGFDTSGVGPSRRGLVGMRERVELLGGSIEIRSEPGQGTQIAAKVPLRSADDEAVLPSA